MTASSGPNSKAPAILLLASLLGVALVVVGGVMIGASVALPLAVMTFALVVSTFVVSARQGRAVPVAPEPVGYTDRGEPVYAVVGYTPDGRAVTADQMTGPVQVGRNPRTNSMAVVALVLGVVVPPLAIPVAQIARGQIERSGEQGSGLAVAGLVLGWISIAVTAVVIFAIATS